MINVGLSSFRVQFLIFDVFVSVVVIFDLFVESVVSLLFGRIQMKCCVRLGGTLVLFSDVIGQ